MVPERANKDAREVFLRTYPIVYRVRKGGILVLTVFEGHRQCSPGADLAPWAPAAASGKFKV